MKNYDKKTLQTAIPLILNEQSMAFPFLGPENLKDIGKVNVHDMLQLAELAAFFIPAIGPLVSLGIAGIDATIYWNEGDRYSAGFSVILSAIPLIGQLAKKIPGVKQLSKPAIKQLAKKLSIAKRGGKVTFTKTEQSIVKDLAKNKKLVQSETSKYIKKLTDAKKAAKSLGKSLGKGVGTTIAAKSAWDPLYTKLGLDVLDLQSAAKPFLEKIKQSVVSKNINLTPGLQKVLPHFEQIIREEYQNIILEKTNSRPFANQQQGDAFRAFMINNYPNASGSLNLDVKGPWNSPDLIKAYNSMNIDGKTYGQLWNESNKLQQQRKSVPGWATGLVGYAFWGVVLYLGYRTGKGVFGWLNRSKIKPNKFSESLLQHSPEETLQQLSKLSDEDFKILMKRQAGIDLTTKEVKAIKKNAKLDININGIVLRQYRQNVFRDFIKYKGQGTFTADDVISAMTDEEIRLYSKYVREYAKTGNLQNKYTSQLNKVKDI